MTTQTDTTDPAGAEQAPRPGSRAARMMHPLALDAVRQVALEYGVCIRPRAMRRIDTSTGRSEVIDLPCGNTRESKCPSCAKKRKRLREVQCLEGWHRSDEPGTRALVDADQVGLLILRGDYEFARAACLAEAKVDWAGVAELDAAIADVEELIAASGVRGTLSRKRDVGAKTGARRKRSTRRRQDATTLPRRPIDPRTTGGEYTGNQGQVYRHSMFTSLTLDSYGKVRDDGSPVDPGTYDYRRAAWDAVHFPALLDRFWQNLRRAEGWNVQYFGCVEPQRRLAPHGHFTIRGTVPKAVLREVAGATYHQVWWPSTKEVRYPNPDHQPVWRPDPEHARGGSYVDPSTGEALRSWEEAMAELDNQLEADPDREPEHVVRFGAQFHAEGVLAGTDKAAQVIRYVTKYMTKSVAEVHQATTPTAAAHLRRLWHELRYTPCSDRCPNWLRYGVQPKTVRAKLRAGHCKAKVHQAETLGIGGRRILVSRNWSGKSLADHRWDQAAWVRRILSVGIGHTTDKQEDQADEAGKPLVEWELARPGDRDVGDLSNRLLRAISTRIHQRAAIAAALSRERDEQASNVSATTPDQDRRAA
jgi:hypothetical protein